MFSLYGDARQWYFYLPPSSISSLKYFHRAFTEHCKRYFSDELVFGNCYDEYGLHHKIEDVNRDGSLPHNMQQPFKNIQHDALFNQHELEMDQKGVECFSTIIKSDCCESEELISLTTHGNYQLSTGQMTIEISNASSQFPYLQIKGSCSNHEEQDFQGISNLQLEHQEDLPSPYEYVA